LAAPAGVRYSLENHFAYVNSNLVGHATILEMCRNLDNFEHLVYASSSSVYGGNKKLPFSTSDSVDHPLSLYAATKKADELLSHSYSHLYKIPTTGLRFFTVYGPWGRPDMATFLFTKAIIERKPIDVFNNGDMRRDFTYIDDIVNGVIAALDTPPSGTPPYKVYNIGNNNSENLMDFIRTLEDSIGKKAEINFKPMHPGDVKETYADIEDTIKDLGFLPKTTIKEGIPKFVEWYKSYY
jgi:UDP-glucuronate 4-epimerase